jgi:DNA-binding MarR family transcriptional regulator
MLGNENELSDEPADAATRAFCEMLHLLAQCHRQLRWMLADRLSSFGLSDTDFLVLWLCRRAEPQGLVQRDLAEALGVSPPQMSGLVERLRQQKLLTSRRCPLDRRRQLWGLDLAGCRLLAQVCTDLKPLTVSFDQSISPQQQQVLSEWLRELAKIDTASPMAAGSPAEDAKAAGPLRLYRPATQDSDGITEAQHAAAVRRTG